MGEVVNNIINTILPVLLIVGAAAMVDRVVKPDPRGLSQLIIYLFAPALVLHGIATTELQGGEVLRLGLMGVVLCILMALIAWGVARKIELDRKRESAFMLGVVLLNAGNFGIPLNTFAFGDAGEERALIFFVGTVLMSNTLGVFIASRGAVSTRQALLNVFTVPLPYAVLLGLLFNVSGTSMPDPLERAVGFLGDAANPAMLAVLGIQLARASVKAHLRPVLAAAGLRLVISPLFAFGLVILFGLSGLSRQVAIVQSGMPSAVLSGVLATEFGSDAEFVTTAILVSTLLSIVTLAVLLSVV